MKQAPCRKNATAHIAYGNEIDFYLRLLDNFGMFICICNAITERQVQRAVSDGARTLADLQGQLGVAGCCGSCADTATEYLPGGRYAGQVTVQHDAVHVASAANDPGLAPSPMLEVVAKRA